MFAKLKKGKHPNNNRDVDSRLKTEAAKQNDNVSVLSTGSQEGAQLGAKAAAAIPLQDPGSSLAPAPLGAGRAGRGGGRGGGAGSMC